MKLKKKPRKMNRRAVSSIKLTAEELEHMAEDLNSVEAYLNQVSAAFDIIEEGRDLEGDELAVVYVQALKLADNISEFNANMQQAVANISHILMNSTNKKEIDTLRRAYNLLE